MAHHSGIDSLFSVNHLIWPHRREQCLSPLGVIVKTSYRLFRPGLAVRMPFCCFSQSRLLSLPPIWLDLIHRLVVLERCSSSLETHSLFPLNHFGLFLVKILGNNSCKPPFSSS